MVGENLTQGGLTAGPDGLDFGVWFGAIDQSKQIVLLISLGLLGLILAVSLIVFFVNRSKGIAMKIDWKSPRGGITKNFPNYVDIYLIRHRGGGWVSDKWGSYMLEGKKVAGLKFLGGSFPIPRNEDVLPGNRLLLVSPQVGEFHPLVFSKDMKELKPVLDYDVIGHAYNQLRMNAQTFSKPGFWEKYGPFAMFLIAVLGSLVVVYICTNYLLTAINTYSNAQVATGSQIAEGLQACLPPKPAG